MFKITKKEFDEIMLDTYAGGFNAGFGSLKMKVAYCKKAKKLVLKLKVNREWTCWLCQHE